MPDEENRAYTCLISPELDRAIQKRALELAAKNQLIDERGDPIEIRVGPRGRHIARYSIARIALTQFAQGNGGRLDSKGAEE